GISAVCFFALLTLVLDSPKESRRPGGDLDLYASVGLVGGGILGAALLIVIGFKTGYPWGALWGQALLLMQWISPSPALPFLRPPLRAAAESAVEGALSFGLPAAILFTVLAAQRPAGRTRLAQVLLAPLWMSRYAVNRPRSALRALGRAAVVSAV